MKSQVCDQIGRQHSLPGEATLAIQLDRDLEFTFSQGAQHDQTRPRFLRSWLTHVQWWFLPPRCGARSYLQLEERRQASSISLSYEQNARRDLRPQGKLYKNIHIMCFQRFLRNSQMQKVGFFLGRGDKICILAENDFWQFWDRFGPHFGFFWSECLGSLKNGRVGSRSRPKKTSIHNNPLLFDLECFMVLWGVQKIMHACIY